MEQNVAKDFLVSLVNLAKQEQAIVDKYGTTYDFCEAFQTGSTRGYYRGCSYKVQLHNCIEQLSKLLCLELKTCGDTCYFTFLDTCFYEVGINEN